MKDAQNKGLSPVISPPRYLSRAEKTAFHRIVKARLATNLPVMPTEIEVLADFCESRTRLAELRETLEFILPYTRSGPSASGWVPVVTKLVVQIESSTAFSHRLARDLKLVGLKQD